MPRILQSYTLWVALVLILPTSVILGTWNLLPGEQFYNVKRSLENVPKIALGNSAASADYEVALTNRRFDEASTLVKSNNTLGLSEFNNSLQSAEQKVISTNNTAAKQKLISDLNTYNQQLQVQKQQIIYVYNITYIQNPSPTGTQPPPPQNQPTYPTPTSSITQNNSNSTTSNSISNSVSATNTVNSISQTQDQINQIVNNLNNQPPSNQQSGSNGQNNSGSDQNPKSNFSVPNSTGENQFSGNSNSQNNPAKSPGKSYQPPKGNYYQY